MYFKCYKSGNIEESTSKYRKELYLHKNNGLS